MNPGEGKKPEEGHDEDLNESARILKSQFNREDFKIKTNEMK